MSRTTAYRKFHEGTLPVPAHRDDRGNIVVNDPPDTCRGACLEDLHVTCLTDAVLAELQRRGYRLDQLPEPGHNG